MILYQEPVENFFLSCKNAFTQWLGSALLNAIDQSYNFIEVTIEQTVFEIWLVIVTDTRILVTFADFKNLGYFFGNLLELSKENSKYFPPHGEPVSGRNKGFIVFQESVDKEEVLKAEESQVPIKDT
ncbi:hypothetical protein TWF788_002075 [Orbilia oligospora]|uniref:Uncharacterized protein n=1 Tax=Orbilia oligospora TaxID=2813651 RepID=A0A7C8K5D2_ORBOL|nr:hypothetical protein TWF788_002075 [Orbilia oligospora]